MKRIKEKIRYPLVFVLVVVTGCTQEASQSTVEVTAQEFFGAIKSQNYDKAMEFYSDEFFNLLPREAWLEYLKETNATLGELQKSKLRRSHVNTVFSGRRFVFEFSNQYANGFAKETLIFFQKVRSEDILIQMHRIESKLLGK